MPLPPHESVTIERIVSAARDEFAELGFAGARVDAIARRAGVNKALLYYHVGGKAAIYERVLHDTLGNATDVLAESVQQVTDPVDKLRIYIRALLGTIHGNPQIPAIILQELANGARHVPAAVAGDFAKMFALVTGIVKEGVQAGVFRDTAPVLIHFMVVGPAIFHPRVAEIRGRFEALAAAPDLDRNFDIELAAEIEGLVLKAVCI